jgi:uncharacterized protein YjbI with pentapeptide repeats
MGVLLATFFVLLVIAAVVAQEPNILSLAYWQEGGASTSRSEVLRNLGFLAAGVIALAVGSWRAYTAYRQTQASQRQAEAANEQARAANEQARIAQQGHITDRFSRAVEHLGSEELPVRLGGIYALWRLIKDSPERDVISVIDILCAFVRDPPHVANATNTLSPDVQTVLNLIGNENANYRALLPAEYRLDLTGANLRHAHLTEADLHGAKLTGAKLAHADLAGANLAGANLAGANLAHANLPMADLTRVDLWGANLTVAHLYGANLTGDNLRDANLTDADLLSANLTGANLRGANLKGAILEDANLTGADLSDTNVAQEQLDLACISKGGKPPNLPEGLKPPQKECVR